MRSRRCFAVAGSSLALFVVSCLVGGDDAPTDSARLPSEDQIPAVGVSAVSSPGASQPLFDVTEDGAPEQKGTVGVGGLRGVDGCRKGEMRFEGDCTSKKFVKAVVEQRERQAVEKVRTAKEPADVAEGTRDLLEQQTIQADKAVDDLDEILEELRRERDQLEREPEEDEKK